MYEEEKGRRGGRGEKILPFLSSCIEKKRERKKKTESRHHLSSLGEGEKGEENSKVQRDSLPPIEFPMERRGGKKT